MVINAGNGQLDAVLTVSQENILNSTQKKQARLNINALSSDMGAVQTDNLASNSITEVKISDNAVTRSKLAPSANSTKVIGNSSLIGETIVIPASYVGYTIAPSTQKNFTFDDTNFQVGDSFIIQNLYGASQPITGTNKVIWTNPVIGDTTRVVNNTLFIPPFARAIIKKFSRNYETGIGYWAISCDTPIWEKEVDIISKMDSTNLTLRFRNNTLTLNSYKDILKMTNYYTGGPVGFGQPYADKTTSNIKWYLSPAVDVTHFNTMVVEITSNLASTVRTVGVGSSPVDISTTTTNWKIYDSKAQLVDSKGAARSTEAQVFEALYVDLSSLSGYKYIMGEGSSKVATDSGIEFFIRSIYLTTDKLP